jgi:2-oxo-4-hydroxy-4-carboxy-5-ureidoimidazoline decarboxylase
LNPVLERWHTLPPDEAAIEILSCCGSRAWAAKLVAMRPFADQQSLFAAANHCWQNLREGHHEYEERFGRIFIVCASGKQPAEMLRILQHRLTNDPAQELLESAAQQQQIMQLRLRKWLEAA